MYLCMCHMLVDMVYVSVQEMPSMSQFLGALERAVVKLIAEKNELTAMSVN